MDPMTMMAIANFGMQMMGGNKGAQQQPAAPQQQQQQKPPFQPGPLPPVNQTDYGQVIRDMMAKNQMPGAAGSMPAMGGL